MRAAERAAYEEKARHDGHADFQITERGAEGARVRAGERAEYFPGYFVERLVGKESRVDRLNVQE